MSSSTKTLLMILLALVLFAAGYIGYGIYHHKHIESIQNGNRPGLPS